MDCLRHDNLAFRLDGTDPETGILRGRAVLAKEGVYRYGDANGNTWAEYVPTSTLTDAAWLNSLRMAPVTLNHPPMMVDADNARSVAVGAIGDSILKLGDRIASPITVWDRAAVQAATSTHGEISLGYMATIEVRDGEWNGQKYDRVQVARRANHVALVDKGRHGAEVRLHADAARMDGAAITADDPPAQEEAMTEQDKARLDAAEAAVTTEKERADAAEAKVAEAIARADKAEAERDAAKAEIAQVRADALTQAMARVALQTVVQGVCGADFNCEGKTDRELRLAALDKLGVRVDAARSDDYVIARLDAAIDAAASKNTAAAVLAAGMNQATTAQNLPVLDANTLTRSLWAGK